MRRAWLLRSGRGAEEIDGLRRAGQVGLSFDTIGDPRGLAVWEIEQALRPDTSESAPQLRSRLMRFVDDVSIGDLAVIPNADDHEIWFATVTGPYTHAAEPPVPHFAHLHAAEWIGWAERGAPWLRNKLQYLDAPGALIELRDPGWWFSELAGRELPPDRPHRPRRAPEPARAARASNPRTPRAPRAPRPAPAPPAPKPPELVLCEGQCGLQWRPAVLVGGLCPDCRGD